MKSMPNTPKRKPPRPPVAAKARKAATAREVQRAPTYDDILAIARLIESGSRFSEFRLRSGDIEVEVKRANGAAVVPAPAVTPSSPPQSASAAPAPGANAGNLAPAFAGATVGQAGATAAPAWAAAGEELIRSPMVGTFYRSPQPGAPPFVEPGSRVEPSTIVCIIEVMKLMNSVAAGVSGAVTHVFADNGQMVEPGQPLIAIKVDA